MQVKGRRHDEIKVGGETAEQPLPPPEGAPKFEDWLLGVASWYVSQEGSKVAADKPLAPAGLYRRERRRNPCD